MSNSGGFRLANEGDDAALREMACSVSMPGDMALAFHREPSYFIGERAGNLKTQTLLYEDESGRIRAIGSRGIRRMHMDGRVQPAGYLSMLRLAPEVRGSLVLARGYKALHELHQDGQAPFYVTTILEGNIAAKSVLESGRAGLPVYVPSGTLTTWLIPLRRKVSQREMSRAVTTCREDSLEAAISSVNAWNQNHQFAPHYELADLRRESEALPGFDCKNFYVWNENGNVRGTLGVWDQGSFKQTVVTGYSPRARVLRPFYNGMAWLRGLPSLPRVGQRVRTVYACLASAESDEPTIFRTLLMQARIDWSGKGIDYLTVCFAAGHPLARVAQEFAAQQLKSTVYVVHWPEDKLELPGRGPTPHLEIATL